MLLFLMIPLSLLAFTIAIGPVLVMTLVEHHARRRAAMVPARVTGDRHDAIDVPARSGYERPLTVAR
jgi:hypothetical protein